MKNQLRSPVKEVTQVWNGSSDWNHFAKRVKELEDGGFEPMWETYQMFWSYSSYNHVVLMVKKNK